MADFNRSQIFNGTCAPFLYIADCSPTARTAYMNASRFWLAATSLSLITLIVAIIRRSVRVKERLNTLRLTVICFTLGAPLYVPQQISGDSDHRQSHLDLLLSSPFQLVSHA